MKQSILKRGGALLAAIALVLVAVFAFGQTVVANAADGNGTTDSPYTTWADLKSALEGGATGDVYVSGDIVVGDPITVSKAVTIRGADAATFLRDGKASSYDSMFKVASGGNLTLSEGVTLSGKTASCSKETLSYDAIEEVTDESKVSSEEVEDTEQTPTIELKFTDSTGAGLYLKDDQEKSAQWTASDGNSVNWTILNESAPNKWSDEHKLDYSNLTEGTTFQLYSDHGWLTSWRNNTVTAEKSPSNKNDYSTKYVLDSNGYIKTNGTNANNKEMVLNYFQWAANDEFPKGTLMSGSDTGKVQLVKKYPTKTVWKVEGDSKSYEDKAKALAAATTYKVEGLEDSPFATLEDAKKAIDEYNKTAPLQCKDPACSVVTADKFNGAPDAEKGFFVQVEQGGTATLDGATLTNFITDQTVTYAAPVVVNGGTFNLKSGSIEGNNVGYAANHSQMQWPAYTVGLESEVGNYKYGGYLGWDEAAKTNTAGGIIYTNGATGEITGGKVFNNRGDTGGVIVQGASNNDAATKTTNVVPSKLYLKNGEISNNVGLHGAGGLLVFNGGRVQMEGGKINGNFAWHKGGGVYVSEEALASKNIWSSGDAHLAVADAVFIMNGGEISGNDAVARGGGIEVASNHVNLYNGTISNNNSRVLGGGIYVEGDSGRMYQLYIAKGCITGNTAVNYTKEASIAAWPAKDDYAPKCDFDNTAVSHFPDGSDVTWRQGFWGGHGNGGGMWLCPLGGNVTFSLSNTNTVIVAGNKSDGGDGHGSDIFLTAPRGDAGNGMNLINEGTSNFVVEGTNTPLEAGNSYAGPLGLHNSAQDGCTGGLTISGNTAPNGGGIASNGTVVFGDAVNTYRTAANIDITKDWSVERTKEPVTVQLFVEKDGKRVEFDGDYNPLVDNSVKLNGIADTPVTEPDPENPLGEDEYNEGSSVYESAPWVASMGLPLSVIVDGETLPLFTVELNGETLNPTSQADLQKIYEAGDSAQAVLGDYNLVVVETDAEGNETEYKLPLGGATLELIKNIAEEGQPVTYTDIDGDPIMVGGKPLTVGTYTTHFSLAQTIANDSEPQIEKYVAKQVHKEIDWTEEFPYDIMVYVPMDADSIRINDTLDSQLVMVSSASDIEASVKVLDSNDHTVHGSVENGAASEASVTGVATIAGQKLTFEVEDAKAARGKFIQISFVAKLSPDAKLNYTTVTDNKDVLGGEDSHEGIPNTASYDIKVGNEWDSNHESNTVTVKPKPEQPEIEKYVNKNVHKEIGLGETFTYDVVAYVTRDADELEITDTLDSQLQFASAAADVKVVSLAASDADHTPDTGKWIEAGTAVANAAATIKDQTLTVSIPDATAIRGQWVKVTFDAKIKDGLTVADLTFTDVKDATAEDRAKPNLGNDPVVTDEDHTGVPNAASYKIKVGNDWKYNDKSNTVTVKPSEPTIEKYVAKDVHKDVSFGEVFTYDIIAYATPDATKLTITDELVKNLEFASKEADVKVVDLGTTNNHKTNGAYTGTNDDASVTAEGKAVDAQVAINGQKMTVVISDVEAKGLQGHYIRVTFDAALTGDATQATITDNGTVASDKEHTGVPNKASYVVEGANGYTYGEVPSNTVTVKPKPETPEIEKYVNKNVHKDIALDESFTYDIVAFITKDADNTTIVDTLNDQLQFVSTKADVKVALLGETVDHTPNGSVAAAGEDITKAAKVNISGQTLSVFIADAKAYRGQWVKVTFDAKIADGLAADALTYEKYTKDTVNDPNRAKENLGNAPVITDEEHEGVPNTAEYTIGVGNKADYYSDKSNTVTVKPKDEPKDEKPQIEKYVNKDVHKDIELAEVFPYDVIVYVPTDADTIQIRDTLVDQLQFCEDGNAIAQTAVVKSANDHTVRGTVSATDGVAIEATGAIDGKTLTVDVADATAARGKYIQITFNAKIADGLTIDDLAYSTITDNGDVLGGADSHTGVPNTAEYRIGIKNGSDVDYSKYAPEGDKDGWNKSNTVTVKPEEGPTPSKEFDVTISKRDITSNNELPGATIKITDAEGNKIDEWTSTDKPHVTKLAPGTYTLEEVSAPEGYDKVTTTINFTVAEDGTVTLNEAYEDINGKIEVLDTDHLVLSDKSKPIVDEGSETTEAGARANVATKNWNDGGNASKRANVTFRLFYAFSENGPWIKTDQTMVASEANNWEVTFKDLGRYVDGKQAYYRVAEDNIDAFEGLYKINADEEIVTTYGGNGMGVTNHPNNPNTEVLISKRAVGGGDELPGATIQIIDANGNVIHEFVSGTEPTSFTLAPGVYTLREITAPDGYEKTEDMSFRVNVDGTVECLKDGTWVDVAGHVVMEDAPSPEDEGGEKPKNPESPNTNKNSTPKATAKTTPRTAASATTRTTLAAKTSDEAGLPMLGLGLAAAAAFAAGAYSLRRRNAHAQGAHRK